MKKTFLIIFALFVNHLSFGQEEPKFPKYNARNAAQLFYYNLEETPKKIKVKKQKIKNKTIQSLRAYNDKVKKVSFLNTPKLLELEYMVNAIGKKMYYDRDLAEKVGTNIRKVVSPVLDSVYAFEKTLNTDLKSFLTKKQFKKWLKYQKQKKRELQPKQPSRQNQNLGAPRGIGNQRNGMGARGMGGRRF